MRSNFTAVLLTVAAVLVACSGQSTSTNGREAAAPTPSVAETSAAERPPESGIVTLGIDPTAREERQLSWSDETWRLFTVLRDLAIEVLVYRDRTGELPRAMSSFNYDENSYSDYVYDVVVGYVLDGEDWCVEATDAGGRTLHNATMDPHAYPTAGRCP